MQGTAAHSAILLAALMATQPVAAQDAGSVAPDPERKSGIEELLDQMRGLPDLKPAFDPTKPVVGIGYRIVDGEVAIATVMEGSAAEAAGLEPEMIIEKINGVRLSTFSMEEIAKLIAAIDGELTFAIRDRGEVTLRKAPIEQQGS